MPTVLRVGGLRVVIYPNDHPLAHVHVLGPGWLMVINLFGPKVSGSDQLQRTRSAQGLTADRGSSGRVGGGMEALAW